MKVPKTKILADFAQELSECTLHLFSYVSLHERWGGDTFSYLVPMNIVNSEGGTIYPGVRVKIVFPPPPHIDYVHRDEIGEILYSILLKGIQKLQMTRLFSISLTGRGSSIGSEFAWHASGPEFDPQVRHILSWRLGHENISTAILPLPLIQEEQLSVTGERMCTKYW